ncbi:hypothetical protein ACLBW8_27675, partial [Pseudomonas sp. M5A4_2d]
LTRRPAGLPTDSSLRSAIVVNGACQIKINSRSNAEHGGLKADLSGRSESRAKADQKQGCFSVGAGLPAMQTPRYIRHTQLMPSQRFGGPTSQLPHLIEFQLQKSGRLSGRLGFAFAFDLTTQVGYQAAVLCF